MKLLVVLLIVSTSLFLTGAFPDGYPAKPYKKDGDCPHDPIFCGAVSGVYPFCCHGKCKCHDPNLPDNVNCPK